MEQQTTQKQVINLLPLPKSNYEKVIQQYGEYIKKLKKLAGVYKAELEAKKQNSLNMAEIAVKAHDLNLKILTQEKTYTEHIAHYNTTTLPQFNRDVQAMQEFFPEIKITVEELVSLKDTIELNEKQTTAVKLYEDYKTLSAEQQENPEIKLVYFKEIKKQL